MKFEYYIYLFANLTTMSVTEIIKLPLTG